MTGDALSIETIAVAAAVCGVHVSCRYCNAFEASLLRVAQKLSNYTDETITASHINYEDSV